MSAQEEPPALVPELGAGGPAKPISVSSETPFPSQVCHGAKSTKSQNIRYLTDQDFVEQAFKCCSPSIHRPLTLQRTAFVVATVTTGLRALIAHQIPVGGVGAQVGESGAVGLTVGTGLVRTTACGLAEHVGKQARCQQGQHQRSDEVTCSGHEAVTHH